MPLRIATDVGGTFTDLVYFREESGELGLSKALSTPSDFSLGVAHVIDGAGLSLADITYFVHGCTVVINAITERRGAKTALVTTAGFRDVLEIGRNNRPDMYNLTYRKPRPFVPRYLRFEVRERVDKDGHVVEPIHPEDLEPIVKACRDEDVGAVAICFLHSYAHPDHEVQAQRVLRERLPGVAVCCSAQITREWREYERTSTAVLNAYVLPIVSSYLANLEDNLTTKGARCEFHVLQSNGGTATFSAAKQTPIYLIESGPAAGVAGAALIGHAVGEPNIISLDIGGTTAKCSLIEGGELKITTDYKTEWRPDFAGYPVKVPVIDIVEIGAGGGSIAWVDDAGALNVGPRSAGASPGPACYNYGGTEPTVTDAKLIAGVINPEYFLGGQLRVDAGLARRAMAQLADRLGIGVEAAANGVIRLVDAKMINALKLVSVRRGHDPRDFALLACGGGGPMHACALATELRLKKVIIPPHPGHFSAWAMLVTEPRRDLIQTRILPTTQVDNGETARIFASMEAELELLLSREGDANAPIVVTRSADMRYAGQEHTVKVPIQTDIDLGRIESNFHRLHKRQYTFELPDSPIEFVNFHVTAFQQVRKPAIVEIAARGRSRERAFKGARQVDLDVHGVHTTPVYERELLPPGFSKRGPLIVEELASTTLVHPDQTLEVDRFGNLIIHWNA
jgi:N-methylhydantoinase A